MRRCGAGESRGARRPTLHAMRCPSCKDDFEPHVTWCGTCRVDLVPEDAPDPPGAPDTRLGLFHPTVSEALLERLEARGCPHETVTRAEGVEIIVPREERDDLRAQLTLDWSTVLVDLPEEQAGGVRRLGGLYPGWVDAPEGGWIDREGRLVVDSKDDAAADASRTVGPALAVVGVALLLLTWYSGLGMGFAFAGVAMLILGLVVPR